MERMGRADTHVHTDYSGFNSLGLMSFPESVIEPEKQVDDARRRGLDVLCITDHNEVAGGILAQKYARRFGDIDVVVGDEVMTDQGEVIGLWMTEKLEKWLSPEEAVDLIHEQGGLAIAPHPFSVHVNGMQEKILDLPLDGIEVINGGHPDPYSNLMAQRVAERYPGRWAAVSGSDAHSLYTAGYNWTEFKGRTEDDFRKAILHRKTVPVGVPAPVLGQVQWSMEVVWGGQKLMYKSLRGKLPEVKDNSLVHKINTVSDIKKATGIVAGFAYQFPLTVMLATLLSVSFLKTRARKALREMDVRMAGIDSIIADREAPSDERPE